MLHFYIGSVVGFAVGCVFMLLGFAKVQHRSN